jgi:hypothetical protein
MLLIYFDPSASQVNVISIPRDTRTLIPGHGAHKINVANVYGGSVLAAQTGTNLGGAPINRYVRIFLCREATYIQEKVILEVYKLLQEIQTINKVVQRNEILQRMQN